MDLIPFEHGAGPIKIEPGVSKAILGRMEVKKSLDRNDKLKISKDQVRFIIDHSSKSVDIESLGVNPSCYGEFGDEPVLLKPNEKARLKDNDIIGFGRNKYIYQIKFRAETNITQDDNLTQETRVPSDEEHFSGESDIASEPECSGPSLLPKRKPCEYGLKCYRKNPQHKSEFSHPGDQDFWDPLCDNVDADLDTRPECEFGLLCYQKNNIHRRKFAHNTLGNSKPRKRRAAMKAKLKDFSDSSGAELENSSESDHSDWSDDKQNTNNQSSSSKLIKLSDAQKELLKETQNLLRKNVF